MTIKQHGGVFGRNPAFNDVSVETLSIAGTALASTAAELNILDGVTADATEINYLDGASTSVVTASKAVLANASANIPFASGKGIDFSATGDGSGSTSELFDDYEEGEYQPTITCSVSGSITLATRDLFYVKVGRKVTVTGFVDVDSVSSPTGTARLSLPFATNSDSDYFSTGVCKVRSATADMNDFGCTVSAGVGYANILLYSGTDRSFASAPQFSGDEQIFFSFTYMTD